jgi:hypothetical protein
MALTMLEADGTGWNVAAKQTARVLPAVGDKAKFWDAKVQYLGLAELLTEQETTITAVDASNASYSREFQKAHKPIPS